MKFIVFWVAGLILSLVVGSLPIEAGVYRGQVAPRPGAVAKQSTPAPAASAVKKAPAKAVSSAKKPVATAKENVSQQNKTKAAAQSAPKKSATKAAPPKAPASAAKSTSKAKAEIGAKDLRLNVKSALLINMSTGKIYFEQNPDQAIAPASITKLLTLFLVREAMAKGQVTAKTSIPISSLAVQTGGSRMNLKRGGKVPLEELIKGMSVASANNACVAVAEYLGQGDARRFVKQMNAKAQALGMTKSNFRNPSGLPAPDQLSTARDLAKLSMAYLRIFPESLSVHSMTTHTYGGATKNNANSLLRTYKGVDGLKTGFVCASGYNIAVTAKRGKTRFLAVVLGAQSPVIRQVETTRLLDYGFKSVAAEQNHLASARK